MKLVEVIQNIDVWSTWVDSYKKYVPQFIQEAKTKNNWQDWDKDIFREFFEQSRDQCVSSLQQGYYTNIEKDAIKKNWGELAVLLKKIADQQDQMDLVTYNEIKKWLKKHTSQNRKAAANRLIASLQPNLLCTIVNEGSLRTLMHKINELDNNAQLKISSNWFENSNRTLNYFKGILSHKEVYDIMTYPWQTFEILTKKETNLNSNEMSEIEDKTSKIKSLLEYKKQIILQGPPGTGKTREAKLIAKQMIGLIPDIIKNKLFVGSKIANASGAKDYYTIKALNDDSVTLISDRTTQDWNPSYNEIIEKYNQLTKGIEPSNKNGMDPYSLAVAKHLNEFKFEELFEEQFKIIQFHPSYTYEDFVRGIVSQPNPDGEGIIFKAENKTLGKFAKLALDNYLASKGVLNTNSDFENRFTILLEEINVKIDAGKTYGFSDKSTAEIISVGNDYLIYNFPQRQDIKYKLLFSDIEKVFNKKTDIKIPIDLRDREKELQLEMKGKYPYYFMILEKLKNISSNLPSKETKVEKLKNYILIIDEINRANLSSVLGELIYALEYRGEAVESMYDVNGNDLILPQNFYIIGTMNTADRSVGHIDYAIRRRFAFVDVLPKDLSNEEVVFDNQLFLAVKSLFTTDDYKTHSVNLSKEFDPKDVALGHSYFIQQYEKDEKGKDDKTKPIDFQMRLEYEIKPILLEYVKDGILIGNDIVNKIEQLETSI